MPSQIESRVEKLENSLPGAAGVVLLFGDDDDRPIPTGATVIRVLFTGPEDRSHDDQTQS